MNRERIAEFVGGILIIIVVAVAIRQWGEDKAALASADEVKIQAQRTIKAQQATIDGLEKGIKARDAAASAEVAKYEPMRHVKTGTQAAAVLLKLVNLPEQPKEVTSEQLDNAAATIKLGSFVWTPDSMIANTQRLAECKQHDILLAACQSNLKDIRSELTAEHLKFVAQTEVSKKYEIAAKGGTKLHRVFRVLKPIGCAAAGAAAGSLTKNKVAGAAVGAGAGGIFCAIF